MKIPLLRAGILVSAAALSLAAAPPALGLANRVFVSARSGNNANACDNILTPCQTFAGAVLQLNPGGEAIVLDSGGYGPVTITQAVTIEAPPGVLAFIHPPSGNAITINAGASDVVTLRGLVLNGGPGSADGINVSSAGTVNIENCAITGFTNSGISMFSAGRLNVRGTDVKACQTGLTAGTSSGAIQASIDHCHLDSNGIGLIAATTAPGSSKVTASYSTADNNTGSGWTSGGAASGKDVLYLEYCTGSENGLYGLSANSNNAASVAGFSNCLFSNNGQYGVGHFNSGTVESRLNNTVRNNFSGTNNGTVVSMPSY